MITRILAIALFLGCTSLAQAQTYSFETTNKETFVFSDRNSKDMHLRVKNNTGSAIGIKWKLLNDLDTNNFGGFAFCDPSVCIYYVNPQAEYETEIEGGATGDFKLTTWAKPTAYRDTFSILFWATATPTVIDTISFMLDAGVLSVANENHQVKSVSVYPNPVANMLNFTQPISGRVIVYTVDGKRVISETKAGNSINVESLKPGLYIIEISNSNGVFRSRFIKQ